ncbi:MAG TPA: molecular chaperone HtpG [Candidatus Avoscillospira stercorigallinarum]|uniref:Chaperone protein HtpG n=1 Tax=Candidatus Avoscillospira stercorigallinarum TaxID=2840708 RepID=A0A9D0Z6R5_9FIRM|nr:molecular chaperone HtpG [Candidatus Avoscillospira stercorigallinarum]
MEKKEFQAESKRLLDLMINSIYTNQEIFLREIISNASDAIDKLAYQALTDQSVGLNRSDFAITLKADEKYRLLTISDNGIGMTQEEMEENLGTIAKSGSLQFKKDLAADADVDIIGQFGVGFYSAFMVSEAVTVISKKFGSDQAYMWQSSGADGYTITPCERDGAGTDVILKLKADTEDENYSRFLKSYELRSLVKKYSDYIRYPIKMDVETQKLKEQPEGEEKKEDAKPEYETVVETETFNSMVPLWQRKKKDITEDEYAQFYRDKFFDFEAPLSTIHFSVEGAVTYQAMLFIPARAPYDYYTKDYKKGLQLYSSGVLIMENCADLLPEHFRFVRGVVDSQDLSLNISREMLQHDRQLKIIANNLEKKIKAELVRMEKDDREKYEKFFAAFGRQLKYGVVADYGTHKDLLQELLLFWSSKENKLVTLQEYVDAMPEDQKFIYFAAGESRSRLQQLPQAEPVQEKGYDILFFTDEVDEFVAQTLMKVGEKEFRNVAADDLGLQTEEEKKAAEETETEAKDVLDFLKETLGEKVKEVRLSKALKSHPVCLAPDAGMSFEMEKYMKRVNPDFAYEAGRILEINAGHPVFAALRSAMESDPEKAKKYARLLYSQALLMADLPLENPTEYTDLVCSLMQ